MVTGLVVDVVNPAAVVVVVVAAAEVVAGGLPPAGHVITAGPGIVYGRTLLVG